MRKRKSKLRTKKLILTRRRPILKIRTSPISGQLIARRTIIKQAAIFVRRPATKTIPTILSPGRKDKLTKLYSGFQTAERVTSCDQKRERRRRAFFGYLNAPHAGKGAAIKRKSPRSDRFTVRC